MEKNNLIAMDRAGFYHDNLFIYKKNRTGYTLVSYTGNESKITIPEFVTRISNKAFKSSKNLENLVEIEVSNSVHHIDNEAFIHCKKLEHLVLPEGLHDLHSNIVAGLTKLNFAKEEKESLRYLGTKDNPYYYLIKARTRKKVNHVSSNCKIITVEALAYHKVMQELTIPDGVYVAKDAAIECPLLNKVEFGNDVILNSRSFGYCKALDLNTIDAALINKFYYAFNGIPSLTKVVIPEGEKEIPERAFIDSPNLKTVIIPKSLRVIGKQAFLDCEGLEEIDLQNVEKIDNEAFSGCVNLEKVNLNSKHLYLGKSSFAYNYKLSSINLPDDTILSCSAFEDCKSLPLNKEGELYYLESANNPRFILMKVNKDLKELIIDSETKFVSSCALELCPSLQKIKLPFGLIDIDNRLFEKNKQLQEVILPQTLKEIDFDAFCDCSELIDIKLPTSLNKIGMYAFENCKKLESIYIPSSVLEIECGAFKNCYALNINVEAKVMPKKWSQKWNMDYSPVYWNAEKNI